MAYGLKYSQYLEKGGVRLQIKVYQKDYSGASYGMAHITGAALQVVGGQSDILSPTLKTAFSWSLADCWDEGTTQADGTTCVDATGQKCGKWEEFYTNDATKYKVELSVLPDGGTASVIWTGFVTPDSWSENLIYRGSVTITARDMLGALRDREFSLTGRVSVLDIVQGALAACECPMALSYTAGHFLVNADGSSILAHSFAASAFSGDTWKTALDETLESLGLVLRYNGVNGIVLTSYRYIKADTLRGMHGGEFTGRSGLRALDPATKEIVDVFDVDFVSYNAPDPKEEQFSRSGGTITCSMGSGSQAATGQLYAYNLTRADGEGWAGNLAIPLYGTIGAGVQARGLFFPTNVQDTQNNIEATYINPRIDGGFKFSIEQDGPLVLSRNGATSSATFLPYTVAIAVSDISVRVEVTSGGTTSYLHPEGGWTNELTYLTIQPGEEVEVPVHNSGGTYRIVVKQVRSAGIMDNVRPVAPLLAALLLNIAPPANSTSPTEYKVTTIYNEDNNVTINRTPSVGSAGLGGCVDFYENVLALGDTLAANQWNWPGESDYYPLAVMVQAQVLCYYSAAASVFTGTLHDTTADDEAALPGYGVSYYQRDCVAVNATYDFVSGLVGQSTFREVYTWEQVWGASFAPQYTQRSGAGRGSTSATGDIAAATSGITGTASTSQIPTLAISKISGLQTALDAKQPLDADLTAIAGLTGTSGFLKKTAANTWALDTNTYLTDITSTMVTNALGYTPANVTALGNYVLKSGDTMTGSLTIDDSKGSFVKNFKYQSTSGWARAIVVLNVDGISKFVIGAYGSYTLGASDNGINYAYIGVNSHDGTNLRFGSDSTLKWGTNTILHAGNYTSYTPILNSASAHATSTSVIYAPTSAGTSGQVLISSGSGAPSWATRTNWDDYFGVDASGNVYVKKNGSTARGFYSYGFVSAGGVSSGGGAAGVDLTAVWDSLTANTGVGLNKKIHTAHIPDMASTYGYLKSAPVTSVAGNTGAVTAAQISSAIGLSGYVTLAGTETISGLKTFTSGLRVSGRVYSSGDDEGIVIAWASNNYATISLGSHNAERSTFSIHQGDAPKWVYNNGTNGYTITHPAKNGTIALTSDIPNVPSWAMNATKPSYTFAEITDKLVHSNEFNFIPTSFDGHLWFNYRSDGESTANVSEYRFGNGSGTSAYAAIRALSFIKEGGTSSQFLKADGSVDSNTYLTGNQTITLSGDVSGSGATSISVSIGQGKVTNAMLAGSIANGKLANSSITINGSSTSLGGSFSTASITAGTAGQSTASTGVSFSIPYVTMNAYGIVTAYGTHTHTISASDLTTAIGSTTYAPYNSAGYLPLNGGTMSGSIIISDYTAFGVANGTFFLGHPSYPVNIRSNGTTQINGNTLWHSGNANLSTVPWNCSTLTASGNITLYNSLNFTRADWNYLALPANGSLHLSVGGSVMASMLSNGNVGIGTTTPYYKLDVAGGIRTTNGITYSGATARISVAGWYTVYSGIQGGGGGQSAILHIERNYQNINNESYIIAITAAYNGSVSITQLSGRANYQAITKVRVVNATGATYLIQIYYAANSFNDVRISGEGCGVFIAPTRNDSPDGVGTSVQYSLSASGIATSDNIVATGAITAGSASDRALKTNISTLSDSDAKALIMALRPVTFTWNDKATELYDQYKGDDLGFVAQEVENVLPVAIGTIFEKYKRLDQTKFIAPLVAVAKDHETRIEKLEKEVKARDAKIMELESEVKRLRN